MLLSLFVYIGTALLLFVFATNYTRRNCSEINRYNRVLPFVSFEIIASLLLFALVSGLRYNTGVDYLSYLDDYNLVAEGHQPYHDYEFLFMQMMRLFAENGIHYSFFFGFCGFLQLFFVYYALKDHKYLLPFVGLYVMLGPLFLTWMNGLRQCIVVCFFVLLSTQILKRNIVLYVLGIICASFIHKSAWFLLPLFLLTYVPVNWMNNTKRNILILGASFFLGTTPVWLEHMTSFQLILDKIGYFSYSMGVEELVSEENLGTTAMGPGRIMLLLLDVILIIIYPSVSRYYKDRFIDQSFMLYFMGTCIYNLFANTSHLFLRPVIYLTVFIIVILPATLVYLRNLKVQLKYYFISCLAYMYIVYIVFRASFLVGTNSTDLYHFFFL